MKNDNWTTPDKLYEYMNKRFRFNVDAAASEKNSKCKKFFSKKNSFLDTTPFKLGHKARVFCNPPYSLDQEFAEFCLDLYRFYAIPSYLLLPVRSDRVWYQKLLHRTEVRDEPFTGRIHFGNAKGGAFMYNIGVVIGFKTIPVMNYIDAGQFNKGGKGSATT